MDRKRTHVISVLVLGVVASAVAASETPWRPSSRGESEAPTAFAWIPAAAPQPRLLQAGSISAVVGSRSLGGAAWRNLGPAYQAGLDWSPGPASWRLRPVIGYRHARGEGEYAGSAAYHLNLAQLGSVSEVNQRGSLTAEVDEIAVGAGRSWSWGMLHATVGAGGCWVRAQVQDQPAFTLLRRLGQAPTAPAEDAASGYGWWGAASVSIAVSKTVVGIEGRYTDAPLTVFGDQLQAGGWQLGGSVGWTW
jgi:hypothetical protein